MPINDSGKWLMLTKDGEVVEGESHPHAAFVLAAPGANVPQDVVDKHNLGDRIKGEPRPPVDVAGRPVVHVEGGRAVALDALPDAHPARKAHEDGQRARKMSDAPREAPRPEPKPDAPAPPKPEPPKPAPPAPGK